MRDNGNNMREPFGMEGGSGVVRPSDWTRTEAQLSSHEGFSPEAIKVRGDDTLGASEAPPTMQLAKPPAWTHRDDLVCTKWVPTGNGPDFWDTTDRRRARVLCAACPVRAECLDAAMEEEGGLSARNRYLVRGGLTPRGRAERAGVTSQE